MDALINLNDCREYMTINVNDKDHQIKLAGTIDDPYFCGKDVCEILGYKDIKQALQDNVKPKHKKDLKSLNEAGVCGLSTPLGSSILKISYNEGKAVYINEPGLYSLIMKSKAQFAEAFQDLVYEVILPSIRKYGNFSLEQEFQQKLAIKDKELLLKDKEFQQKLLLKDEELKQANQDKKICEARTLMIEQLSTAHRERLKTQIFYIVTSKAMAKDGDFKIGGTDSAASVKKRLSIYNTGSSGVNPDLSFYFVALFEVSNYKQVESRVKELLSSFRSKRNPNTENFNLHYNIFRPLIELIVENYTEEIDKLNEFIKAFLETHTTEYMEHVIPEAIDPEDMPSEYKVTVTKRRFGEQANEKIKLSELDDTELKEVLTTVVEEMTSKIVKRVDIEKILIDSNYAIMSHKRRIWDLAKEIIKSQGKEGKY